MITKGRCQNHPARSLLRPETRRRPCGVQGVREGADCRARRPRQHEKDSHVMSRFSSIYRCAKGSRRAPFQPLMIDCRKQRQNSAGAWSWTTTPPNGRCDPSQILSVCRIIKCRQGRRNRLHPDRNRQAERYRSAGMAGRYPCPHSRLQDQPCR